MNEVFWIYTVTLLFVSVIIGLLLVYRYFLGNRLAIQAERLRREINRIPRNVVELSRNPSGAVEGAIEDIGIDGIIDSLGLPKFITPFIKGFVSNPENITKLLEILKGKGINIDMKGEKVEGEGNLL